jgi:hypothetical protein
MVEFTWDLLAAECPLVIADGTLTLTQTNVCTILRFADYLKIRMARNLAASVCHFRSDERTNRVSVLVYFETETFSPFMLCAPWRTT